MTDAELLLLALSNRYLFMDDIRNQDGNHEAFIEPEQDEHGKLRYLIQVPWMVMGQECGCVNTLSVTLEAGAANQPLMNDVARRVLTSLLASQIAKVREEKA